MRSMIVRELVLVLVIVALAAGLVATGLGWHRERTAWTAERHRWENSRYGLVADLEQWRAWAERYQELLEECEADRE